MNCKTDYISHVHSCPETVKCYTYKWKLLCTLDFHASQFVPVTLIQSAALGDSNHFLQYCLLKSMIIQSINTCTV